ncbi:reprolysin-like metallopeptidase [uncultured Algibacter sp.]|uniref:reprolysin-like metallopeptidase n=1 Tax=uncultured Algibacter sp. TaxID=298659 RepID=UPI0032167F78
MFIKTKLHYVLSIAILLSVFSSFAQNSTWKQVKSLKISKKLQKFQIDNDNAHMFELDMASFVTSIENTNSKSTKKEAKIINIPGQLGKMEAFKIFEAPVLAPELSAKYPHIKSYVGVSLVDSKTRLRMSVSPQGVQTMISYVGKPSVFMQPIEKGSSAYVLYSKDAKLGDDGLTCKTIDALNKKLTNKSVALKINEGGANNQTLHKFRLAVSTTSEYTAYHDDGIANATNGDAISDALAAINASISRVNEVFENDMSITFEIVANSTMVIFNDAASDPYSDAAIGVDGAWSNELQTTLTSTIGESNYDIGHLLGATGGGGNGGCIGCVCVDNQKGRGYTSPANGIPETDTFDINFLVHEIGHQMGANHSWAFESEGTGVNSEPGSGTTIMAYAGLEGANNVELNSDDYFHYHSIKQILDNLRTKSCQTTEPITNNPPIANAGPNYNIPKGTAYILKGNATDADGGDNLTYCWEQFDDGVVNFENFGPDLVFGSTNRSLPPSVSKDRFIPKFASVVAGNVTQTNPTLGSDWETVSTVARTLSWALTVRDRDPSAATGAQTSFDTMQITVEDVDAFEITNPVSWVQNETETIAWTVGETNNATINCQLVNIKLSTDGGVTFPINLATNAPNNGSFSFTVPDIPDTSNARVLIEAADNIFYDVSDFDFLISSQPDFFISDAISTPLGCNETSVVFNFEYAAVNGFSENTVFNVSGQPAGSTVTFSPTNLSSSGMVTLTISDLNGAAEGTYPLIISGTSSVTSITRNQDAELVYFIGQCASIANTDYNTSITLVQFNTINQASAKLSGYSDFKVPPTMVNRDNTYNLTVNVNTDGDFLVGTKAWIDWNQNCSFDDPGEEYDLGTASNVSNGITGNIPLPITIPSDANLGTIVMRITTKFLGNTGDEFPFACDNGFDGEVEDYALNVTDVLIDNGAEEFGFKNLKIFPNPTKEDESFTFTLVGPTSRNITIEIFDTSGRLVYNNEYKGEANFRKTVNVESLVSGLYILSVSDGIKRINEKIIKR